MIPMLLEKGGISIHALCEEGDLLPAACTRPPWIFLSTPSARRATGPAASNRVPSVISIHALCEEGDFRDSSTITKKGDFYPRPLRGGRPALGTLEGVYGRISIHALCEEGDGQYSSSERHHHISIHALCEEGDTGRGSSGANAPNFYPRPLRGGRPSAAAVREMTHEFLSTPSARRATCSPCPRSDRLCYFYPRPLRGGRP